MNDKSKQEKKGSDQEAREDLRADRDDSMGYSREQFIFDEESPQPAEKQPKKKPGGIKPKKSKK